MACYGNWHLFSDNDHRDYSRQLFTGSRVLAKSADLVANNEEEEEEEEEEVGDGNDASFHSRHGSPAHFHLFSLYAPPSALFSHNDEQIQPLKPLLYELEQPRCE